MPPAGSPVTGAVNTPATGGPAGAPGQHPNQLQPPHFQGPSNPMPPQATASNPLPGVAPGNPLPPEGAATRLPAGQNPGAAGVTAPLPNGQNAVTIGPLAALLRGALPGGPVMPGGQGAPLGANIPLARQPVNGPVVAPTQGLANPRADAAATALQGRGQLAVAPPNPAAAQVAMAPSAATAQPGSAPKLGQSPLAANAAVAAQQAQAAAGRAMSGPMGSAQAVAQAQTALAQALGKVMAGQTTAGTGAMALAEAQLALRASKLALTQAHLAAQALRGGSAGAAVVAGGQASGGQPVPAGAMLRAGGPAATGQTAAVALASPQRTASTGAAAAQAQTRAGAKPGEPAPAGVHGPVTMPRALAAALAMAPKLRKRGSYDRVEAIDRHTPRQQAPEMEDEDFWDGAGEDDDSDARHALGEAPGDEAEAQRRTAQQAAAQHYRAMHVWLAANAQQVLLRELAAGRCVLVLAPPDKTRLRLIGHLLRPDAAAADGTRPAGATGRAWALAARWSATLPADAQWRQWRLRQAMDAEGAWHIGNSQPDRHTPRLLATSDAAAPAAAPVGESITVLEPRRLRRLMGTQWTMTVLRVPVPLNDSAPVAAEG